MRAANPILVPLTKLITRTRVFYGIHMKERMVERDGRKTFLQGIKSNKEGCNEQPYTNDLCI